MKDNQQAEQQAAESNSALNQTLNKFTQGIKDDSKIQRKNALESIKKQILNSFKSNNSNDLKFTDDSLKLVLKSTLNLINDPIEKCRELSLEVIKIILENFSNWNQDLTGMLIMSIYQRLGTKDIKEPSEEIRLQIFNLLNQLIDLKSVKEKTTFEIHLQELISILANSFNDNYPEVKKVGCLSTKLIANRLATSNFHMQSESLVKPLLANIVHQHSKVRKDIIDCLCDVVMHGNNKSVTEVIPHLAQRLFDQTNTVRMSVIKLVGTWLLDLPDRYSFHNKLIPLLLTGFIDESADIKELTESLWWDVGIKYEKENEEDLKDKANFLDKDLPNYPVEFKDKRPNLGCRELIRLNASKILPGILNDIGDWVEATRIKSIQLLYIMIWQAEKNTTQHLVTILQTLFKASSENLQIIQDYIFNCSRLIGIFTDAEVSLEMAIKTIKKMSSSNHGSINILNGLLIGFGHEKIDFNLLLDCLNLLNEICLTLDTKLHTKILDCCLTLLPVSKYSLFDSESKSKFEYIIFKALFTMSALSGETSIKVKSDSTVAKLDQNQIKNSYLINFINELKSNSELWNDNSFEPYIFAKLLKDYGLSQNILDQVVFILKTCLNPNKDVQLKTKFLLIIPDIFTSSSKEDEKSFLESSFEDLLNQMLLPNIIWKAGRAAGAVRMSACASLLLILHSDVIQSININENTLDSLLKMMLSCLDDDNKSTRLYVCKIFFIILENFGKKLDKDQLHKFYTEFIKRLDDQSEEIRFQILQVFHVYLNCLNQNYDRVLYQAHLQVIYENLLLYLDDSNFDFQQKVFDLLKHSSALNPELLLQEIEKVKNKHRNTQYCEDLANYCKSLS